MPPVPYAKPFQTIPQQLALLQSRGLAVSDDQVAKEYLERIGYYRLSGYWYPFRLRQQTRSNGRLITTVSDTFRVGSEFKHVIELYVFDKRLRLLFMDAIERIEVAIRVDIALLLGARDPVAHRNTSELHGNFVRHCNRRGHIPHTAWLEKLDKQTKSSKEEFVKHFASNYSTPLPIWVAIELWDFGMLATFFQGMKIQDRTTIANKYGLRPEILESWLSCLNHVRNICAHHSRLWNRTLSYQPKWTRLGELPSLDHLVGQANGQSKIYVGAVIAKHLLGTINPNSSWPIRLKQLIADIPNSPFIGTAHMGFPQNWEQISIWS